jgi:DNA-binding SARP family transcriptional activator
MVIVTLTRTYRKAPLVPDLRFQVLGPVRAWQGEREVNIGARKQRAVLAVLLLDLDQPLSADDLVTAVWREQAPPAAYAAVHTYVRGLRDALEPDRAAWSRDGVVSSGRHGYQLRIEPDQVDSRRFQRLIDTARRAWADGDARATLDASGAALTAWTGPPLAGLGGHFARHPGVVALEHERLVAGMLGTDAALACGRLTEWIPPLAGLAAQVPLHEPLQARLVETYGRAGRRAEALATYDRIRRALRDELGIDPGPELTAAFRHVLAKDQPVRPLTLTGR